jgi:hypothetical protein
MYPAQALFDGLYSVADLPDEILVTQILLELDQTLFTKTGDNQNFYTGIGVGGNTISVVIDSYDGLNGETVYVWALDFSGELFAINTNPFCLIFSPEVEGGTGTEDQFADTYTVSGGELGPIQVTRVSLCLWGGTDSCGNKAQLIYLEDPFNGKLWFVDVPQYGEPCVRFDVLQGEKIGLQNTPVGGYGNPPYENPFLFVS